MAARVSSGDATRSPPPERGRSAREASRVGVKASSRFNRTSLKTVRARNLRRASTEVEMRLWQKLRNRQLGVDFRRQHPAGNFVLDYYAPALRLVIELDGGQHAQHTMRDTERTRWLASRGSTVLRFWNSDVTQDLPGVLEVIAAKIAELRASGLPPTRRWRADLPRSGGGNEPRGRH
ncbi:MAG: endonuclease domain-containing protein [Pseudolabrys sp.]